MRDWFDGAMDRSDPLGQARRACPRVAGEEVRDMDGYAFEAEFTGLVPVGLVPTGARIDVAFTGTVTEGPLAGSRVEGIDYLLMRRDGTSVIDVREVFLRPDGAAAAVTAGGYVVPPVEMPPLEAILAPGFAWPDLDLPLHGWARVESMIPEVASANHTVYAFTGTANVGTGRLSIRATSIAAALASGIPGPLRQTAGSAARQ